MRFRVRGRRGDIYAITVAADFDDITLRCSCPAGGARSHCWHRLALLKGSDAHVVEGDVGALLALIRGTPLEAAVNELARIEHEQDRLAIELSDQKGRIAALMDPGRVAAHDGS